MYKDGIEFTWGSDNPACTEQPHDGKTHLLLKVIKLPIQTNAAIFPMNKLQPFILHQTMVGK